MKADNDVTIEEIEDGMLKCATLVDRYGECMMPLLNRLEREYEARKNKTSATDRIKKMLGK